MKNGDIGVIFQAKGERPGLVVVGTGATVRSALVARKMDPENIKGDITLNGKATNLNARLKTNDLLAVTPNTAGGSR